MQIQISWLLRKPTDLDLHCLLRQGISGFSRTRVKNKFMLDAGVQRDDFIRSLPASNITLFLSDNHDAKPFRGTQRRDEDHKMPHPYLLTHPQTLTQDHMKAQTDGKQEANLVDVAKNNTVICIRKHMKTKQEAKWATVHTNTYKSIQVSSLSLYCAAVLTLKNEYQYIKIIYKSIINNKNNQQNMFVILIDTRFLSFVTLISVTQILRIAV